MFEGLLSSIESGFSNLLPSGFCAPCFVKGVLEGAAVGLLAGLGLAALAAASPVAATIAAVALAVLGVVAVVSLVSKWGHMNGAQKSEALGGLLGGAIGGGIAGGGVGLGIPSSGMGMSGGAATLEMTVVGVTVGTAPAAATGAGLGAGGAMMMTGEGGDSPPDPDEEALKRGEDRAAEHGEGWEEKSLQETVDKVAGPNPEIIQEPGSSKTIYRNPENGKEVVYDRGGDYFRVRDPSIPGKRQYVDSEGNPVPNNRVEQLPNGKTRQVGKSRDEYQKETHFKNTE